MYIMVVTYCTDFNASVILNNFEKRGWVQVGPDDDWNFYWSNVKTCSNLFSNVSDYRLHVKQIINHFPHYNELTHKDNLIKNIKRYKRELKRDKSPFAGRLDFIPATFALPADYNLFVDEYHKVKGMWIMKPVREAQGKGIVLVNKLSQLKKWFGYSKDGNYDKFAKNEQYVISKYIEKPLLIGGQKFDVRFYVLVTTFCPLKAYLFKLSFCRFCTVRYDTRSRNMNNPFIHLTNVSIQKESGKYNKIHGGKFSVTNLKIFLENTRGKAVVDTLFENINQLIVHSLKSVSSKIINDRHCFECYGYDIIIDSNLKPWLLEINASPSLAPTTEKDSILKNKLVDSILNVVLPPNGVPDACWNKRPSQKGMENFELLIDEELTATDKPVN